MDPKGCWESTDGSRLLTGGGGGDSSELQKERSGVQTKHKSNLLECPQWQ